MSETICVIRGDGVGPEVIDATIEVVDAAGAGVDWVALPAGSAAVESHGQPLPERTVAAVMGHRACLAGPIDTPRGSWAFTNVERELHRRLGLYAVVRPVRSLVGVPSCCGRVDLLVIRENSEGVRPDMERTIIPGVVESAGVTTLDACGRFARWALDYAESHGRRGVTLLHRSDVLAGSSRLMLESVQKVQQSFYPKLGYRAMGYADGTAALVREPGAFDVLLTDNLTGDVLAGVCCGMVGGANVVGGGAFGEDCAVFGPIHGLQRELAGQGVANPVGCLFSAVMLLRYVGLHDAAERIRGACEVTLANADASVLLPDIGGQGTIRSFVDAVKAAMR